MFSFTKYRVAHLLLGILIVFAVLTVVYIKTTPIKVVTIPFDSEITDSKLAPRSNTVDITSDRKENVTNTNSADLLDPDQNQAAVALSVGCKLVVTIAPIVKVNTVQYGILLRNRGTEDCQNVTYSVYYPEHELYLAADPKPSASDYYWVIGTIKSAGATKKLQLTTSFSESFAGIEVCATASNSSEDACMTATNNNPTKTSQDSVAPVPVIPVSTIQSQSNHVVIPAGKEYGVWVWNSPITMSAAKMDTVITNALNAGFNTIYITIDDVKNNNLASYTKAMALFVAKAQTKGLAVDAVAGASDWAKPVNRAKGYGMIEYVIAYNKTNPKLRGFQFDVEPYLLPEYEGNKELVLTDFVNFIDESERKLHDSGLTFGVVIPHFYDSTQAWTPKVNFTGSINYTFNHLMTILDRGTGNSIIVMSYRNYFSGKGGTEELSTPEISQAGKTKVIVAQETGNVQPSYVTFYGTTRATLNTEINAIYNTFSAAPGFGGVAVHYLDTFSNLK